MVTLEKQKIYLMEEKQKLPRWESYPTFILVLVVLL